MILSLLGVTFVVALATSWVVARVFQRPLHGILGRIVAEEISAAWVRYLTFAIYVVGLSGGVRIWAIERYLASTDPSKTALVLDADRWVLEIYGTIIGALQSLAWMLLVFFGFALIAYVVIRGQETRAARRHGEAGAS